MSHSVSAHRRLLAAALALITAVTAVLVPVAPKKAEARSCPAVVVIAARGSGQPNSGRTNYGGQWTSNGWEGEHIRAFLRNSDARYRATHNGKPLMNSVEVLGMEPKYYPAYAPSYTGPLPGVPRNVEQLLNVVSQYALPALGLGTDAARSFIGSVNTGRTGVVRQLDDYQRATGCRPQVVLAGFSQGAMVVQDAERELARRKQLAGVVTFGNPLTAPGDPATIGVPGGGAGGLTGWLPANSKSLAFTSNRVNYCLPLDGVCDASVQTADASRATGGNHGRYFVLPSQWDNIAYDRFGNWVDGVRYRR